MYEPLLSSPLGTKEDAVADDSNDDKEHSPAHTSRWGRDVYVAIFVCAICTFVNSALTILPSSTPIHVHQSTPMSVKDIRDLRRPSHFIGFDQIARPSPPMPRQFNNYPLLLAQIDSANVERVFPVDAKRYMPHVGTITPEHRRFLVNSTVSTIVQFRAIDWGMESCELRLSLPSLTSNSLIRPGHTVTLSVYRVNATKPLDATTLSFERRPDRVSKVANIELRHGHATIWHRNFACTMEQVLTFEVGCSETDDEDSSCSLEWWQNRVYPDPAVYMIQHATA